MANREGYCEHGVYVGGCGIEWMCGHCENGVTAEELAQWKAAHEASLPRCEVIGCQRSIGETHQRILHSIRDLVRWAFSPDGSRPRYCTECLGNIDARRRARAAARSAHTVT